MSEVEGRKSKGEGQLDRLPPHAPAAEAGVLGCVLLDPGTVLDKLAEWKFAPEWFYDLRHARVFAAMQTLHAKRDVPVDIVTLQQYLRDAGQLEEVGGVAWLASLGQDVPSAMNVAYYADLVREKWVMRTVISTCTNLVGTAYEWTGKVDALLAEAEHQVEMIAGMAMERRESHIKDVLLNEVMPQLEEHYTRGKQRLRGLSTGFTYLDKLIRGIRPNYYFVIAGRPGDGKTSLAMNLVTHTAAQKLPVAVFTLEMTADSLATRLLFSVANVDSGAFEQGFATKEDFEKLTGGLARLAAMDIYLDPDPDQTIEMIAAKARRMVKEHGIKLFVLDYLQLMDDDQEGRRPDRVQSLRRISKKLVSLKNKLNVPWLVLAQMNRNIETAEVKRIPVLSDLKECGAIEQDADVVLFLYPPLKVEMVSKDASGNEVHHADAIADVMTEAGVKRDDWPRRANASVSKNRYGPVGTVQMLFQSNRCQFHDWRDWATAKGIFAYGKGERASANQEEEGEE